MKLVAFASVAVLFALPSAGAAGEPRGGVLRIVSAAGPTSIDPALGFDTDATALLSATCLTLLDYTKRDGRGGRALAPAAAAAMPRVTNGGRTYTFTLRRNLRFSDGSPLTAANYVEALNRIVNPRMNSFAAITGAIDDVVGVREVASGAARRVRGIRARGRILTIRLIRPAPDILARVATTPGCPVPLGAPIDPAGVTDPPLPGSGPYYIASYQPRREVVLRRNPYYRGPRPRRPVEIRETIGGTLESNAERVERGEMDFVVDGPPPTRLPELIARYGVNRRQLLVEAFPATGLLALNVTRPLFKNNVGLRRAIAFALDRPEIIRQIGYPLAGRPTDQLVPPTMRGFVDRRLFPTRGPNVKTARRYARGRLRGGRAVLYALSTPLGTRRARIIQYNAAEIGLDVDIRLFPPELLYQRAARPSEPYDMVLHLWGQDWPDPAQFVVPFLHGRSVPTGPTRSIVTFKQNLSRFDNAAVNRQIDAAARLSGARRFRAFSRLEADVLRRYVPLVPIYNTTTIRLVGPRVRCVAGTPTAIVDYGAVCLDAR